MACGSAPRGQFLHLATQRAVAAAAICVTRPGAADSVPHAYEIQEVPGPEGPDGARVRAAVTRIHKAPDLEGSVEEQPLRVAVFTAQMARSPKLLLVFAGAIASLQFLSIAMADTPDSSKESTKPAPTETLVVGGGCFWCVEAAYDLLDGVTQVESGYAGGSTENPDYKKVCTGKTGHAEVVRIHYDPSKVSLRELVDFFWEAHDPTTLNRQGVDVGTQYRSIILYQNEEQRKVIEASLAGARKRFSEPVVTQVVPLEKFYVAEVSHQDYFANNPNAGYCRVVIAPKIAKLKEQVGKE